MSLVASTGTQLHDSIFLIVFNKPMNDLIKVKLSKAKNSKEDITVISKANFLIDDNSAQIKEGLKDKFGGS